METLQIIHQRLQSKFEQSVESKSGSYTVLVLFEDGLSFGGFNKIYIKLIFSINSSLEGYRFGIMDIDIWENSLGVTISKGLIKKRIEYSNPKFFEILDSYIGQRINEKVHRILPDK